MFITDDKFDQLEKEVKSMLIDFKKAQKIADKTKKTDNDFSQLSKIMSSYSIRIDNELKTLQPFLFDAVAGTTYDDNIDRGSAVGALYNGNWSVGMFGSVWADVKIIGTPVRIAYYNQGGKKILTFTKND